MRKRWKKAEAVDMIMEGSPSMTATFKMKCMPLTLMSVSFSSAMPSSTEGGWATSSSEKNHCFSLSSMYFAGGIGAVLADGNMESGSKEADGVVDMADA